MKTSRSIPLLRLAGRLVVGLAFLFALAPAVAAAEKSLGSDALSKPVFRIENASLRSDESRAEFCVVFNAPIKTGDRARFLAALDLRKEGKKIKLTVQDISLSPKSFCVQNLEHRARYDFLLRRIESASGLRLAQPYDAAFVVPDRKPFLSFASVSNLSVLPRHIKARDKKGEGADPFGTGMAHVLRSVNVEQTRLTLYRIAEKKHLADAWQQFTLSNLSPSESLLFARDKGEALFESDLVFSQNPNVEQTLVAPLPPEAELAPGLYYLAATPKAEEQSKPGLFAGQWFLVSDLRLSAVRLPDGVEVFAGDLGGHKPAAFVPVQILARDGETLAERKTNAEGMVFIPLTKGDNKKAALLVGHLSAGDLDVVDIGRDLSVDMGTLPLKASVRADRDVYQPGSTAAVALRAIDQAGKGLVLNESALKLLRPDRRVYSQQAVPANGGGVALLNVPLPIVSNAGEWFLSWQRKDGSVLAESSLRIAQDAGRTKLEIVSAREGENRNLVVFLKALDASGKPVSFKSGTLIARAANPAYQGWKGYSFGLSGIEAQDPLAEVPFITGVDGGGHVTISLDGQERETTFAVALSATLEDGGKPVSTTVPLRRTSLIGLRPLTDGRSFAENGIARFDVIAVDQNGKRRAENDLYTLIFEEGRDFEWFPGEGHWDYRPLPFHRRVGGGPLAIAATGETLVRWPVTTGQYVIEVTNDDGVVLARQSFEAGRVASLPLEKESSRLRFVSNFEKLEEKKKNKVAIKLDAPAFVSTVVYDGRLRVADYRFMRAGENEIEVSPADDWGQQALIRMQALFADSLAPVTIERRVDIDRPSRDLSLSATVAPSFVSGAGIVIPVKAQKISGRQPTYVSLIATPQSSDGGTDLPVVRQDRVPLDNEGRANIRLNLPLFEGSLRLTLMGWNETQYGEKAYDVSVKPALALRGAPPQRMGLEDQVETSLTVTNNAAPAGAYAYELVLPEGVTADKPLKGNLTLGKPGSQTLSFILTAREPVEETVRFELVGPGNAHLEHAWPISVRAEQATLWSSTNRTLEPGQSFVLPNREDPETAKQKIVVGLLSPLALPDVSNALLLLSHGRPVTTEDIAGWLEASRLWEDSIKALRLIGDVRLETLRSDYMRQLQMRQNEDGGFASLRGGDSSDMRSTATALVALHGRADRPAALAIEWLEQKFQNTWFDEEEREDRVLALAALASIGRADLSVVRYYSETSRDKGLSPRANAALGFALAHVGEKESALFWIDKARAAANALASKEPQAFWAVLRLLATNDLMDEAALESLLAQGPQPTAKSALLEVVDGLSAWGLAARRGEPWTVQINAQDFKVEGVRVFAKRIEESRANDETISGFRKLFFREIVPRLGKKAAKTAEPKEAEGTPIETEFMKLNGEKIDFDLSLTSGEAYLLLISGKANGKGDPLRLILPRLEAFDMTVPDNADVLRSLFPWLSMPLTPIEARASLPTAEVVSFTPDGAWRIAFLIKASRRGEFVLPAARLTTSAGGIIPTSQEPLHLSVW